MRTAERIYWMAGLVGGGAAAAIWNAALEQWAYVIGAVVVTVACVVAGVGTELLDRSLTRRRRARGLP